MLAFLLFKLYRCDNFNCFCFMPFEHGWGTSGESEKWKMCEMRAIIVGKTVFFRITYSFAGVIRYI
ncbi:hypothetical protein SAMN02745781_02922 [Vibrio gazogenes DSM 21264]|uniref:Uncharacterized protein n=1 Tax=Vibrio gazogenes DSM 21264 = NBRC 103151 TaxID=1123492 RepID=A0A1M5DKY6_VIBGA|nr:hypothetical protein SAMN02745781_02922 [Vibrio gazogenes DSM 21264] [Vibrio gazogenes DSM 21264 = NBRC 103151]SJN58186.1 hypothetical protein BQ6471_02910 [Vibrio gazogenes]